MSNRASATTRTMRGLFCALIGVGIALYSDGGNWAFYAFPQSWAITSMIEHVASLSIACVRIGLVLKPKPR